MFADTAIKATVIKAINPKSAKYSIIFLSLTAKTKALERVCLILCLSVKSLTTK